MSTKYKHNQNKDILKLAFYILLLLLCLVMNISLNGALFALIWLSHKQLIPVGLFVSMLCAGITPALVVLRLGKHNPNKALLLFSTGLLTLLSLLGIDCFRLVYQQFNPNHSATLFNFLWYNLLSMDFTLERLCEQLHDNIFHPLYYFGGLTLSILLFYKKHRVVIVESAVITDDTEEEEDDELILDEPTSDTDDSDYLY